MKLLLFWINIAPYILGGATIMLLIAAYFAVKIEIEELTKRKKK